MDITRRATADGDTHFSRLEASLATAKVARRHNSIEMKDVNRHGGAEDANVNELDFNFSAASNCDGVGGLRSLQDVFTVVQYNHHLQNPRNFSEETQIQCFEAHETERSKLQYNLTTHISSNGYRMAYSRCWRSFGSS